MKELSMFFQNSEEYREPSPERFLLLWEQVSHMRTRETIEDDQGFEDALLLIAGIQGAIVYGSCARDSSRPKDLDVVLVLDRDNNPKAEEWRSTIQETFDLSLLRERGRPAFGACDIAPFTIRLSEDDSNVPKPIKNAIRDTERDIVYGYTREQIDRIERLVSQLKNNTD